MFDRRAKRQRLGISRSTSSFGLGIGVAETPNAETTGKGDAASSLESLVDGKDP